MRSFFKVIFAVFAAFPSVASAEIGAPANDANEAMAGLYVGQYSVIRDFKDASPMFGAEYRYRDVYYGVRPTVGGFVTGDGTVYGSVGINWDLPLGTAPFFITPGFGIGGYHQGGGKPLGYALEFRSTIEASYQFATHERVGFALSHLSNAGLGSKNPGVETFQAVYTVPIGNYYK
ncbi:MAG: hypothetical protein B7X02_00610 [Rhodospirillales bacterium 12-54-5]|nr:MAG: hypothetical protein B7X02_00610 [Rhodospirillales bacterium 12-54-5]